MSSPLGGLPALPMFQDRTHFTPAWAGWFSTAQLILQDCSNSGTTAQRPTSGLYVGKPYFDKTLGIPIWLSNPTGPVWVNASGASV